MILSPYVETREILLPSLDIVYGHSGAGANTTSDDHCVSVRDSAGMAIINNENRDMAIAMSSSRADPVLGLSIPSSCPGWGYLNI